MSHAAHSEVHPSSSVPVVVGRLGIGPGALLFLLIAILCSIMQGSFVVSSAHTGRVWPSIDSTKLPLPPANLTVTSS
ncbi:MAG TPA: hypothetical protein VIK27_11585 [Candidatus Aquilonibacter sp.]